MVASLNHFDDTVDEVIAILNHFHMKKCDLNCQRAHKIGFLLDSAFLCGDTEIFLTVCYTHRCLDCGKKRGKELFTVSPTKNLTHRCRLCFFFLTSSYVIRQQWCQLRIDELCATLGEHIYIRNSATKLSEKERQTQRTHCSIQWETERRRESNAVFAFTQRTLLLQQFFFCILLVVLVEFNEIIIWYGCKNYKNRHPFEPHHFWVFFLFSRYFDIRLM